MSETSWPLTRAAQQFGEAPALVSAAQTCSFADYAARARDVAGALGAAGIVAGDRLAILSLPSIEYPILLMGCFGQGVVACPLNTRIPRPSLEDSIQGINATGLLVDEYFAKERLQHIPELRIRDVFTAESDETMPHALGMAHPCTIVFTSGSSAEPRPALHTFAQHSANALAANQNMALEPGDRWLLSLPLFHVSGLGIMFRCLWAGASVAVPELNEPLEEAIPRYGVTHVSVVGTQLLRLLYTKEGVAALSRLKAILVGGSAVPATLIREAHRRGLSIHTSYGLTEMASQVTTTPPNAPLDVLLTSGCPLKPDTITVSPDGEILVRGPSLFSGYVEENEISLPLTPNGWFRTGDVGEFDAAGNLHVLGRMDNMFVSGGENIQPEEVELWLGRLEGVVQAVVVPVHNVEFGSRPVAFVRVVRPEMLTPDRFSAYLAEHLPGYKVPDVFLPWPREKQDDTAKISRTLLRELAQRHVDEVRPFGRGPKDLSET